MTDNYLADTSLHISPKHFEEVIITRLQSYYEAIFGTLKIGGTKQRFETTLQHNIQKIQQLLKQTDIISGELWGYGINDISDGENVFQSPDVEVIKHSPSLNQHHEPSRLFNLLLFKFDEGIFSISIIVMNVLRPSVTAILDTRYKAQNFEYARKRIHGQNIFLDIIFNTAKRPVTFQIETYNLARNYYTNDGLAEYYKTRITQLCATNVIGTRVSVQEFKNDIIATSSIMNINGHSRRILSYLASKNNNRSVLYGSISLQIGLETNQLRQECDTLKELGLIAGEPDKAVITQAGLNWLATDSKSRLDRIREYIYDDYEFALLRFLNDQDVALPLDEIPSIFSDEAPRLTNGYPEMNLLQQLKIELRAYIDNRGGKFEISENGKHYFEHLSMRKGIKTPNMNQQVAINKDPSIFISYCHADKKWLEEVQKHLRAINGIIKIDSWDDTQLRAGDVFEKEIKTALENAQIAILLVSTNFLASKFITTNEVPPLLESAEKKGTKIIPVIIGHCLFTRSKINKFQAANDPNTPLNDMSEGDRDKTLVKLCHDIISHLEELSDSN